MRTDRRMETMRGRKSPSGGRVGFLAAMALLLPGLLSAQVLRYAAPLGAGAEDGSDWANAYSATNLQAAIDAAIAGGADSVLYLQEGEYALTNQLEIAAAAGLTLSGGWAGSGGAPGDAGTERSVLTRDPGAGNMRIVEATSSTLSLYRLQVSNGRLIGSSWNAYQEGSGLHLNDCVTVIDDCAITDNYAAPVYGAGIYVEDGSLLIENSLVSSNELNEGKTGWGGGIHARSSADLTVRNVDFIGNRLSGQTTHTAQGGALYANGGTVWLEDCRFIDNYLSGDSGTRRGGALFAINTTTLTITNCLFEGNGILGTATLSGGAAHIQGAGMVSMDDTRFERNAFSLIEGTGLNDSLPVHSVENLYLDTSGSVDLRNTAFKGGSGLRGLYKTGSGALSLTNVLIAHQPGHGLEIDEGTLTMANSTLADNGGWGAIAAGDVTVSDSIAWGNRQGGLSAEGTLSVTYSCTQEAHAGSGNISADPLFVAGHYLSRSALPFQDDDSPCLGVGSDTAANLGLSGLTTRTDGAPPSGAADLGYHAQQGVAEINNLELFVDAASGDDGDTGWTSGTALESITEALDRAIPGSVIHLAAGVYDTANGESFPLQIETFDLTLRGSAASDTTIEGPDTEWFRIIQAEGVGTLRVEQLTITKGFHRWGSAMYLGGVVAEITDCVISNNYNASNKIKSGAIFVNSGYLRLADSVVTDNTGGGYASNGGGLCLQAAVFFITNAVITGNEAPHNQNGGRGAGIWMSGSSGEIHDSQFIDNGNTVRGGAIYVHNTAAPLWINNCLFTGNHVNQSTLANRDASVLYVLNSTYPVQLTDCVISNNFHSASPNEIRLINAAAQVDRSTFIDGSGIGFYQTGGSSSLGITNSLIYGYPETGIEVTDGTTSIANSTIVNNDGWGLFFDAADLDVENSIAWNNTAGGISATASGSAIVQYTLSQEAHAGDGNKNGVDPLFIDSTIGDYCLQRSSPCVDAGINRAWMANAIDLQGNKRIMVGTSANLVDMGACELLSPAGSLFLFK